LVNAALFVTNYKHYWTGYEGSDYWFVGHFWTLSIEEQFYLLWPAIFCFLGHRRALPAALVIICAIEPLRVISYYFDVHSRGQIDMMLHTSLDCIMIGCVLALIENNPAYRRLFAILSSNGLAILALLYFVAPSFNHLLLGKYSIYYTPTLGRLFGLLWIGVLVIWGVKHEHTLVGRLLNSRPFVYVGTLSYSLYLWQQLFLTPLNTTWAGRFPQNVLCTFVAAQLSYSLVEKPFLRLREKHFKRPVKLPTEQQVRRWV
jgi:peptidoglycan/LPS O-acetylase OafA/YrhL